MDQLKDGKKPDVDVEKKTNRKLKGVMNLLIMCFNWPLLIDSSTQALNQSYEVPGHNRTNFHLQFPIPVGTNSLFVYI